MRWHLKSLLYCLEVFREVVEIEIFFCKLDFLLVEASKVMLRKCKFGSISCALACSPPHPDYDAISEVGL